MLQLCFRRLHYDIRRIDSTRGSLPWNSPLSWRYPLHIESDSFVHTQPTWCALWAGMMDIWPECKRVKHNNDICQQCTKKLSENVLRMVRPILRTRLGKHHSVWCAIHPNIRRTIRSGASQLVGEILEWQPIIPSKTLTWAVDSFLFVRFEKWEWIVILVNSWRW